MNAVGADQQIERLLQTVIERYANRVIGAFDCRDGAPEAQIEVAR